MLTATDLTADGKLLPEAITAAAPTASDLTAALGSASGAHFAALALIAGERGLNEAAAPLLGRLDSEGVAGKALAWALGRLAKSNPGIEAQALAALADGGLDVRENAYGILVNLGALGLASPTLGDAMAARVSAEIERARGGGSGLGEQACRVLAVLGDARTPTLIQQVIEQDRFCDRFELQRLRKGVQDDGRDHESIKAVKAPWTTTFADVLFVPKAPEPVVDKTADKSALKTPPGKTGTVAPSKSAAKSPVGEAPAADANTPPMESAGDPGDPDEGAPLDEEDAAGVAGSTPIDWKAFATGAEAEALPAPLKQLAGQLGPLLEQLSMRAIRAPLADLTGQEFVGLLLQVMPQALPPQHVQMALSPQAMQCYKALVKFLIRTGVATKGQELLDAIGMVRKELTNQIRQAGILNGPDFSDPDDKPAVPPKT